MKAGGVRRSGRLSGLLALCIGAWGISLHAQPGLRMEARLAYAEPTGAGHRPPRLELKAGSRLWLEGTSTLHPYSADATRLLLEGTVEPAESPLGWRIVSLRVVVPVQGLKSSIEALNRNMYRDLKADQHPEIVFTLRDYAPAGPAPSGGGYWVKARGRLMVAGVERDIELEALLSISGEQIQIQGAKELFMTHFGITPRRFLGVMRVDDKITVRYDLTLLVRTDRGSP